MDHSDLNRQTSKKKPRHKIVFNGVTYDTAAEASRASGVNYQTLVSRIKRGVPDKFLLVEKIKDAVRPRVTIDGKEYRSLERYCYTHHMDPNLIAKRMDEYSETAEEAIKALYGQRMGEIIAFGVTYDNAKECCQKYGLTPTCVTQRMKGGMSFEKALTTPPIIGRNKKPVVFRGVEYASLKEFAESYSVGIHRFRNIIQKGVTPQAAMETMLSKGYAKEPTNYTPESTPQVYCYRLQTGKENEVDLNASIDTLALFPNSKKALQENGIDTLAGFIGRTQCEIMSISGIGLRAINVINRALEIVHITLTPNT